MREQLKQLQGAGSVELGVAVDEHEEVEVEYFKVLTISDLDCELLE